MPSPRLGVHLPHLTPFRRRPLVFFTACTAGRRPLLAFPGCHEILKTVWLRSAAANGWYVGRYVIMPDHVHFFAKAGLGATTMALWMKAWKSVSSRQIAKQLGINPPVWQAEYFDHFVRSVGSYEEKWNYVRMNPVRKGLSSRTEDWPHQGVLHDLKFDEHAG